MINAAHETQVIPTDARTSVGPLILGGRPASAVLSDPAALAEELLLQYAENNADYRTAHMHVSHEPIVRVTARALRLVARVLDGGCPPTDEDLHEIRVLIAQNAQCGVSLKVMMNAMDAAVSGLRRRILAQAGHGDEDQLPEINDRIFALVQRVTTLIAVSYVDAAPPEDDGPHAVAEALLAGRVPSVGVDATAKYAVLRTTLVPVASSPGRNRHPAGASRRGGSAGTPPTMPPHLAIKAQHDLAETQRQLVAHFGPDTLTAPDTHPGVTLIPAPADWDTLRSMLQHIGDSLGTRIFAVADCVPADQVGTAAEYTRELSRIVARLRYAPGLYTLADLAVEYQLTRPGPGRDRLFGQLRELHDNAGLLETLDVHIGNDLDRRRTAGALGLHPNTVDHRLKRIARLTGHDPTCLTGLRRLHASSVIAHYLRAPLPPAIRADSV